MNFEESYKVILDQIYLTDVVIVFGNIFFGLILGYIGAQGVTRPWK